MEDIETKVDSLLELLMEDRNKLNAILVSCGHPVTDFGPPRKGGGSGGAAAGTTIAPPPPPPPTSDADGSDQIGSAHFSIRSSEVRSEPRSARIIQKSSSDPLRSSI